MGEEEQMQREWREIVIGKLNKLESHIGDLQSDVKDSLTASKSIAELKVKIGKIEQELTEEKLQITKLKNEILDSSYNAFVSKDQFEPIKKLFYTGIGFVLVSVLGAILAMIIRG